MDVYISSLDEQFNVFPSIGMIHRWVYTLNFLPTIGHLCNTII